MAIYWNSQATSAKFWKVLLTQQQEDNDTIVVGIPSIASVDVATKLGGEFPCAQSDTFLRQ